MSKINVYFNGADYSISDSKLSSTVDSIKTHIESNMRGSGAKIKLGGTDYDVDSTKLSSSTDSFVSHVGTLGGGGLAPITWDGVVGDRTVLPIDPSSPDALLVKVSDITFTAEQLVGAVCKFYVMDSQLSVLEQSIVITEDVVYPNQGGCLAGDAFIASVSDPDAFVTPTGVQLAFNETGTYFIYYANIFYIESLTFAEGGSSGGDSKITIGGVEHLFDSANIAEATNNISDALIGLSDSDSTV